MTAKPFEGWTPGATARVWRLQVERNIVLQDGRRECIDTLESAGYVDAAEMLQGIVDEMQVWIDSNPLEPDTSEEPVTQKRRAEPETEPARSKRRWNGRTEPGR